MVHSHAPTSPTTPFSHTSPHPLAFPPCTVAETHSKASTAYALPQVASFKGRPDDEEEEEVVELSAEAQAAKKRLQALDDKITMQVRHAHTHPPTHSPTHCTCAHT